MKPKYMLLLACVLVLWASCGKDDDSPSNTSPDAPSNTATPTYVNLTVGSDKAIYTPGETVTFTVTDGALPATARVRYKYLNSVLSDVAISGTSWTWTPPSTDYCGYMAEIYTTSNQAETIVATVAVDVSSKWTKFPRYGFLSKFSQLSDNEVDAVVGNLNRYHINGLQFYDWHNKHHMPLPMVGGSPASQWKDIINRDIYFATVQKYIDAAHSYHMKAMFYNLVYGAWDNAEADGVKKEWFVYTDNTHTNRDFHPLSSPFLSNIYLVDPSNTAWQQYLINEHKKVYQYLAFDGFHMDQLGDRGTRYTYGGGYLNLSQTYKPFIDAVMADAPTKFVAMNAVNQYGQQGIAQSGAEFLYTEVWSPYDSYNDLSNLIKQNNTLGDNAKNSVLAAYMNYDLANSSGYFNTPSVLMTNAVIFAFGGAHLELGEHMLGKEYFPNSNLKMRDDLKNALVDYYDFLVSYQNLLRDGGTFNTVALSSLDGRLLLSAWPGSQGRVAVFGKVVGTKQVIHLINFTNSKTQNWRDNTGVQVAPGLVKDAQLSFTATGIVKKLWMASPDVIGGTARTLNYAQKGDKVSFTLPELRYWSMVVAEY